MKKNGFMRLTCTNCSSLLDQTNADVKQDTVNCATCGFQPALSKVVQNYLQIPPNKSQVQVYKKQDYETEIYLHRNGLGKVGFKDLFATSFIVVLLLIFTIVPLSLGPGHFQDKNFSLAGLLLFLVPFWLLVVGVFVLPLVNRIWGEQKVCLMPEKLAISKFRPFGNKYVNYNVENVEGIWYPNSANKKSTPNAAENMAPFIRAGDKTTPVFEYGGEAERNWLVRFLDFSLRLHKAGNGEKSTSSVDWKCPKCAVTIGNKEFNPETGLAKCENCKAVVYDKISL